MLSIQSTKALSVLLLLCSQLLNVVSFTVPSIVQRQLFSCSRPLHSSTLEQTSDSGVDVIAEEDAPEVAPEVAAVEVPEVAEDTVEVSEVAEDTVEDVVAATDSDDAAPEVAEEPKKKVVQRVRHTLFVGNLPYDVTEDNLMDMFSKHATVELINLPKDRTTMVPRGFAFVDVASEEEIEISIEKLHGEILGEREIRVAKSQPQEKQKRVAVTGQKVYVGNIPFAASISDISELFEPYGELLDVYIPIDRDSGIGRGFAFVTMKEKEAATSAIEELNGREFDGRNLVVNEPLPPGEKPPARRQQYTKIYVGNLSFYTVASTLEDLFGEFGEVHDCFFPMDRETGATRGFAFVSMGEEEANNAIAELDGCEVDDRVIRVNLAQRKPQYVEVSDDE